MTNHNSPVLFLLMMSTHCSSFGVVQLVIVKKSVKNESLGMHTENEDQ